MNLLLGCIVLLFLTYASADEYPETQMPSTLAKAMADSTPYAWGYSYDSLLNDLELWQSSPFLQIESIGASVENRAIWMLTFSDTSIDDSLKNTIAIHARTHPLEVQAGWVADAMIQLLIQNDSVAQELLSRNIFHIVPMINPDGVERMEDCSAGFGRCNANGVDLEANWGTETPEPEVLALKTEYEQLMNSENPIRVMLNLHSAFGCIRYFWYHDEGGTSLGYSLLEQSFIGDVRSYFSEGIEPWYTKVSWLSDAPTYFPEGWFWNHYGDSVMALTYEDMKSCPAQEGSWDQTAEALLKGSDDYLNGVVPVGNVSKLRDQRFQNSIQIHTSNGQVHFSANLEHVNFILWNVFTLRGQKIASAKTTENKWTWNTNSLSQNGVYYLVVQTKEQRFVRQFLFE